MDSDTPMVNLRGAFGKDFGITAYRQRLLYLHTNAERCVLILGNVGLVPCAKVSDLARVNGSQGLLADIRLYRAADGDWRANLNGRRVHFVGP